MSGWVKDVGESELLVNFPDVTKGMVGVEPVYGGTIIDIPFGLKLEAHVDGFVASVPLDQKDKLKMHPTVTFKVNFGGMPSFMSGRSLQQIR